jgi:vacuolar-type H+-ATPase subunit H
MRCRVEITDSAPREEYRRPVSYHNFIESGEGRTTGGVRVTGIQAQRKVWTGGEVPVYVTVTNYLDHEKVANVVLQDYTKNVLVGERELILPAQTAKTLTFYWKTRGFSLGEHVLHAEAVSDPEPYYEYDHLSSSRIEQTSQMDRDEGYPAPRRDSELQGIISEAEEILRRVDQEWEEASSAHDRASAEADRILNEADEQAYEQRRQAHLAAEEKAQAILDDACQQAENILSDAEAVRKRADDYRASIDAEAAEHSTEMWEQLRQQAEGEAQQIRDEAVRNAEALMEEVRQQLEAAKTIRELARELSGIAADSDELILTDDEPAADEPVSDEPQDDGMLPKDPGGFAGFYRRHRPAAPETEAESDESEAETETDAGPRAGLENDAGPEAVAEESSATMPEDELEEAAETRPEPAPRKRRGWNWRWYHVVVALALVAAAVMLSIGVISLG